MLRRATWMAAAGVLAGSLASAQDSRVELSATAGWTFSDGAAGADVVIRGVGTFDAIAPKDAFSWGLRLGVMASEHVEVGFLYDLQSTEIDVTGTSTVKLGDESIHNYHGYLAYNFGKEPAKARPYLLLGVGATQFGTVEASAGGVQRDIKGSSKLTATVALGVKAFPGRKVGIRLEGRWTPTPIKSDAEGWWCDPYWGCYVVGDFSHQVRPPRDLYSTQLEVSGGLILRF